MFRLESYITPLVMNYIDRYVKLKQEDFRMSLWGGAAVLNQLDLRLDAIEAALNLPVKLTSGHIRELKIQVPWTKLGFEPVLITINTMECMMSLRHTDHASDAESVNTDSSIQGAANMKRPRSKKKLQASDAPPGYIQSLLNRIVNNVNIVVENLILKFVEEDIVLSVNVKTMEIFSVNSDWKRSYAELSAPDFVLRRLVEFSDMTVCLDKVDMGDGKIAIYQDPLIYRCSLQTRIHTKYENIHSSMPSSTKVHTMCETLSLSLSDTQLPMFLRLLELMSAIYYGDLPMYADKPQDAATFQDDTFDTLSTDQQEEGEMVSGSDGWASWAWSMLPTSTEPQGDSSGSGDEEVDNSDQPSPPTFDISFYNKRASLVLKLSKTLGSGSLKGHGSKVVFEPLLELKMEGNAIEIIAKGLTFFDFQLGISKANIAGIGDCICGGSEPRSFQHTPLLTAGEEKPEQNVGLNYLTGCLFDSSQHHGAISTPVFEYDKHCQKYKESWFIERFGAMWINYLWIEEPSSTVHFEIEDEESADSSPPFVDEVSYTKFWFNQVSLNYTSNMKHRLDKVLFCASNHSYEPYRKKIEENVDPLRPVPTNHLLECLERFIPIKNVHLAVLRSDINVYPSNHPSVDVKLDNNVRGKTKKHCTLAACCMRLSAERVDMQSTAPMYPRKLIKLISMLPHPSGNLIYHCQYHRNIKVMRLELEVNLFQYRSDEELCDHASQPLMLPLSAAYYTSSLLLPMYWTEHNLERCSVLYEMPEATLAFTMPQLLTAFSICKSWTEEAHRLKLDESSLIHDAFDLSGKFPILDISFNRCEVKQSSSKSVDAGFGNLGSIIISVITKDDKSDEGISTPLFQAPADTHLVSQKHLFTTSKPIEVSSDDFLCFTYQFPKTDGGRPSRKESTLVLCTMQGWSVMADPLILNWLLYEEQVLPIFISKPAQTCSTANLDHSVPTSTLRSVLSAPTTNFDSATVTSEKKCEELSACSKDALTASIQSKTSTSFLDYLITFHTFSSDLSVNVNIKRGCILIPVSSPLESGPDHQYNMLEWWRQLSYTEMLPSCLVICLPSVTAKSSNVTLSAPVEDIPVISNKKSITPSCPITVLIEQLSIYSHIGRACHYLLKPVNCSSTISLTTQHHMGSAKEELHSLLSSLSLNVYSDVDPVHFNISKPQVVLLLELLTVWIKLAPLISKRPDSGERRERTTATSTANPGLASTNYYQSTTSIRDDERFCDGRATIMSDGSNISTNAVRTDADATSCSPKLFIRAEVKAPQLTFNVFLIQEGHKHHCLQAVADDILFTGDVYREYFKSQSKIWSVELLHGFYDTRCEEFVLGPRHGILVSSNQRFVNLQSRTTDSTTDLLTAQDISQMMKEKPRDGFLGVTYTRASSRSLKQRLSNLNPDSVCKEQQAGRSSEKSRDLETNYIAELCIDMARCDIVCYLPVIINSIQTLLIDLSSTVPNLLSHKLVSHNRTASTEGSKHCNLPWFDSQTLPLLHLTIGNTRILLPSEKSEANSGLDDVIILAVDGVELTPQADNPLSRLVVNSQLYKKNIYKINSPGSLVDDRQLQMDIHGLSVFAGKWWEMRLEEKKLCLSSSENPAFEWNKIAKAADMKVAKLYPVLAPVQLKLQLAPAIVYQKNLVCGHTMELNATSDILLSITDAHINLMLRLSKEIGVLLSVTSTQSNKGSEPLAARANTSASHQRVVLADYVALVTPVDVLITARHISVSLVESLGRGLLGNVAFTQPHTILCTKRSVERLEISTYDMKVVLGKLSQQGSESRVEKGTMKGVSDIILPSIEDFGEILIESKPGLPDEKTGILPCLFTLKVKHYLSKPDISIENGRPVLLTLALSSLELLEDAIKEVIPAPAAKFSRQDTNSHSDHPASDEIDDQMMDLYQWLPVNTVTASGSQLVLKLECHKKQIIELVIQQTCGSVSLSPSTDYSQLDCAIAASILDAELNVSSAQLPSTQMLGPVSLNANMNVALSGHHSPFASCMISSTIIPLYFGNESLRVFTQCLDELTSQLSRQVQQVQTSNSSSGNSTASQKGFVEVTEHKDDLRLGTFKYLLDKENSLPRANTVLFYSERDMSTLTWSYGEPRVISSIHINPIPFDYPADPNAAFYSQDIQIACSLEYWNTRSQEFTEYSIFSISEQFSTSVKLPPAASEDLVPSRTWRIVINYDIGRDYQSDPSFDFVFAMVSPAVLVAAMRVDSKYIPSLVPSLQLSLKIDQIRLCFLSQCGVAACSGYHEKMLHFRLKTDRNISEHEIFNILITNNDLEMDVWSFDRPVSVTILAVKFQLTSNLVIRFIDYGHLMWKPLLEADNVKIAGDLTKHENESKLAVTAAVSKTKVFISQHSLNALLQFVNIWNKAETVPDSSTVDLPLASLYTICNNTHTGLHIKQVGCDNTSIVRVKAGFAHSFCWSKCHPLQIEISLEEQTNHWSSPVTLDDTCQQVCRIRPNKFSKEKADLIDAVPLFVDVENITCVHKLVTVSGSLCVTSRLRTTELDIRITMNSKQQNHMKISPDHSFSSFAVSNEHVSEVRVRAVVGEGEQVGVYSQPINIRPSESSSSVPQSSGLAPHLLNISGEGLHEVDACYRVISKSRDDGLVQYCIEVSPLYSLQSYLPHSLMLNILPSITTWLPATATTTELTGLNGSRTYQLSLQLSENSASTAVILPLTVDKFSYINNVQDYGTEVSILDVCRQSATVVNKSSDSWPSSSQHKTLAGRFQPLSLDQSQSIATSKLTLHDVRSDNVGVGVDWSQHWIGTASLLMTIKPQSIFVNKTSSDLTLIYGSLFSVMQSGETILSPGSSPTSFSLGVYSREQIFTSDPIHLSEEDVSPRSFFLPDQSVLFLESYTYSNIVVVNKHQVVQQLLYLVVTSHKSDGIRIITLHDRFILHNSANESVHVSAIVAPISNQRVNPDQVYLQPAQHLPSSSSSLHLTTTCSADYAATAAALFLGFSLAGDDWSYPLQIPIEYNSGRRITAAVPIATTRSTRCFCLSTSIVNGVTYLLLTINSTPAITIHNISSLPVAFGQTLTNKSEEVLESMSLLSHPPILESFHSSSYTFATINKRFPNHVNPNEYPRLKIAGIGSHYGVEVWSESIDIFDSNSVQLLHVPDVGEVKVTIQTLLMDKHVYIELIDRAKVAIKEVNTKDGKTVYLPAVQDTVEKAGKELHQVDHHQQQQQSTHNPSQIANQTCGQNSISGSIIATEISVLLFDNQLSHVEKSGEFLRLHVLGVCMCISQSTNQPVHAPVCKNSMMNCMNVEVNVLNINLYNQQAGSGQYDFPLILSAQTPQPLHTSELDFKEKLLQLQEKNLINVKLRFESCSTRQSYSLVTISVASGPLCVQVEDTFIQTVLTTLNSYMTLLSILPATSKPSLQGCEVIPLRILHNAGRQSYGLSLRELSIEKCELLVSMHASVKVFVASDNAPITLPRFSRSHIVSTPAQLITDLGFHYGTGALYCAGWVVGSLELLFNPTGIVRSFMTGLSDLVYLPYYGLQQGPGAFVTGVSQGMTSVVKNVTQGTLSSVTHFAGSVARNMDRLSLDSVHSDRQKMNRQHRPQALSQGLRQGFDGLTFGFLGAVAGLADQPLQGLWSEETSVQRKAGAVIAGVGKGLLGVLTKPISGTAEFISQTGQGLMGSIGLSAANISLPQDSSSSTAEDLLYDYTILKYRWCLPVLAQYNGQVVCTLRVLSYANSTQSEMTSLLLFPKLILVFNCRENEQQQAFALSEIDCVKHEHLHSLYLRIFLTGQRKTLSYEKFDDLSYQHRVKDYVDSTWSSGYHSLPESSSLTAPPAVGHFSHPPLLQEYCVSAQDIDYFITMFRHAKRQSTSL